MARRTLGVSRRSSSRPMVTPGRADLTEKSGGRVLAGRWWNEMEEPEEAETAEM